jgi:hypothetical protein
MALQPAQLVALSDGPNILLDKPILLIGRHQECDIQIPSRKISRKHCCIAQVEDHFVIRDLCSTNGIRINGNRVNEGELKAGDELTIGSFRYQISFAAQPAAAADAAAPIVPGKTLPKPGPLEVHDPFDSCEMPVPIAEPEAAPPAPPPRRASASAPPIFGQSAPFPPALNFPDNIKLAPLSDSQMPPPK